MAPQQFGGAWTEEKLSALQEYLRQYLRHLRRQPGRAKSRPATTLTRLREKRTERVEATGKRWAGRRGGLQQVCDTPMREHKMKARHLR